MSIEHSRIIPSINTQDEYRFGVPICHGKTSSVPVSDTGQHIFHGFDVFECHQCTLGNEEHDSDHWDKPDENDKIQWI